MDKKFSKLALVMLVIALLVVPPLFSGCTDKDERGHSVTIGIMLDFSGTASGQGRRNAQLWEDMVQYTNEVDPIKDKQNNTVTLKVISFDNEYDSAKVVIGYRYLLDRGATVLVVTYPQDGEILKSRLAEDKVPMYIAGPSDTTLDPPGWIFSMASSSRNQVEFFLEWLSTEGWDYDAMGRIPKIGAFGWDMTVTLERINWAKEWVQAHSEDFEWIGEEIAAFGNMAWLREAERLQDADYLVVGTVGPGVSTFINQAKAIGYEGKYVINWPQMAFWDTYIDTCGAETLRGTLFGSNSPLYWEDTATSQYIRTVLGRVDPEMLTDTLNVVVNSMRIPIEAIRAAVEEVGAENVDGQAIYDASLNLKFPPEMLGHPEGAGFDTDRPSALQRECRPSTKLYEYNPDAEYGWDIVKDWTPYPQWVGVTV